MEETGKQKTSISMSTYSGLRTANLSWQIRVGKLQKVGRLVPSLHVKRESNHNTWKFAKWPPSFSAVALT